MRNPRFNALIGSPGSGKSTYMANAIRKYPRHVVVLKYVMSIDDPAFSFLPEKTIDSFWKGNRSNKANKAKIAIDKKNYKTTLQWVVEGNLKNGLLVIDDASMFEVYRTSELLNDLIGMRRFLGLDIWLAYHGFSVFPILQFPYINHLVVFNTNDNIEYKKSKIPKFEELQKAISISKERFETNTGVNKFKPEIVTLSE